MVSCCLHAWGSLFVADLIVGMEELELHYRCRGRSNFWKIRIATISVRMVRVCLCYLRSGFFHLRLVFLAYGRKAFGPLCLWLKFSLVFGAYGKLAWSFYLWLKFGLVFFAYGGKPVWSFFYGRKSVWSFFLVVSPFRKLDLVCFAYGFPP